MEVAFGGRWYGGDFYWSASYYCHDCGSATEMDDRETPDEWRQLELDVDGTWAVTITDSDLRISSILKALRKTDMPLSELSSIKAELPGPLFCGTAPEMDRVVYFLSEEGVNAEKVQLEPEQKPEPAG